MNADHPSVPPLHQFSAGTTAKASEVNENFQYLEERSWDRTLPATDLFYMGGNVGIGTMTPAEELDVVGDINFTGTLKQNGTPFTGGGVWTPSGTDISYSGGKVGIGTTSPATNLDVSGNARFGSPTARLTLNQGMTIGESGLFIDYGAIAADTARIQAESQGTSYRNLVLNPSGGNVGIGTAAPGAELHIESSTGPYIQLKDSGNSGDAAKSVIEGYDSGSIRRWLIGDRGLFNDDIGLTADTGDLWFSAGQASPAQMTLTTAGNVGIGTTSPSNLLHVKNPISGGANITFSADVESLSFHLPNGNGDPGIYWTTGGAFRFATSTDGVSLAGFSEKVRITDAGNVGIGTTSPSNILTVVQTSATDPVADAWTQYSSRRWKTNINPLENALEKVKLLEGVSFDWKADGKHDIGLIAEEVGKVIPEVVAYEENGVDAKSVDYARLVAVLIEAAKEQHKIINEQGSVLASQQKVINDQSLELTKMKAELSEFAQMKARMAKFEAALDKLETLTAAR